MGKYLKSKTIRFGIITILVALFNMFGPADKPVGQMTWKELKHQQNSRTEKVTDLLTLIAGGGAIYGRSVAKGKIGGNDE